MRDPYQEPDIADPPEEELGPAMLALTKLQRRFVSALVATGSSNHARAYRLASANCTDGTAKVMGCRLYRDEKILQALHEESSRLLKGGQHIGLWVIRDLAENAVDEKIRLKAAIDLADRNGFAAVSRHTVAVEHTHNLSLADVQRQLKELGVDVERVALPSPIDAEFSEVTPPMSSDGLEDILA